FVDAAASADRVVEHRVRLLRLALLGEVVFGARVRAFEELARLVPVARLERLLGELQVLARLLERLLSDLAVLRGLDRLDLGELLRLLGVEAVVLRGAVVLERARVEAPTLLLD